MVGLCSYSNSCGISRWALSLILLLIRQTVITTKARFSQSFIYRGTANKLTRYYDFIIPRAKKRRGPGKRSAFRRVREITRPKSNRTKVNRIFYVNLLSIVKKVIPSRLRAKSRFVRLNIFEEKKNKTTASASCLPLMDLRCIDFVFFSPTNCFGLSFLRMPLRQHDKRHIRLALSRHRRVPDSIWMIYYLKG